MSNVSKNISIMGEKDSIKAFCDALKKSASCAREMAKLMEDSSWADTADVLDNMRTGVIQLAQMKAMSRSETLRAIDLKTGAAGVR